MRLTGKCGNHTLLIRHMNTIKPIQLLQCDHCEDHTDDVSYYEDYDGGLCAKCAEEMNVGL